MNFRNHKYFPDLPMIKKAPISFHPYLKSVIWGGTRICQYKGIEQPDNQVGESWEVSEVPGYESVVSSGSYEGMTLHELIDRFGDELLGFSVFKRYEGKFPLLIKFIDANDDISVQVHPGDKLAAERHDSMGKTELWYIIKSESGARIYSGLREHLTPEEYVRRVADKTFSRALAEHESFPGDVFYLPAGRVHAIGAGNLLAEIQQSSDITYRIYDYDRLDNDGKPRELHTELAKEAIDYRIYDNYKNEAIPEESDYCEIAGCDHFTAHRIKLDGEKEFCFDSSSFTILICIEGNAVIKCREGKMTLRQGNTVLIPAAATSFTLTGKATLLLTRS